MVDAAVLVRSGIEAVVLFLEVAAALVILVAALFALAQYARQLIHRDTTGVAVRYRFGKNLLLALDFAIGADVLKVAYVPTLQAAITVGIVVLVRVILTFALERELQSEEPELAR